MTNINESMSFKKNNCQDFRIQHLKSEQQLDWEKEYMFLFNKMIKSIKNEIKNQNHESLLRDGIMSIDFTIFSDKQHLNYDNLILCARVYRPNCIKTSY